MRRFPWTFLSLSLSLVAAEARAQSCCAGAVAITPGRLAMHEDALAAVQAKLATSYGVHDAETHYRKDPPGTSELELEQDLLATIRLAPRAEVSALVPLIETRRVASGARDWGGGLGDVSLVARYDVHYTREHNPWPGVTVVAGVTLPTGRPPDRASHLLAADATGTGAFQGVAGLLIEQTFDSWFVVGAGYLARRTARTSNGVRNQLGTQGIVVLGFGRSFSDDSAVELFATRTVEGEATYGDVRVPGRSLTAVGLTALHPVTDRWRVQGAVSVNPPFDGFGKNQLALATFTVMIARVWS